MRYPNSVQVEGAAAARTAPDFDLTPCALRFARLYPKESPTSATECARRAGYARRRDSGAHVRAVELLRDPRVIRAVLYFGAWAFNQARGEAVRYLRRVAEGESCGWYPWDRAAFERLTAMLAAVGARMARLEMV